MLIAALVAVPFVSFIAVYCNSSYPDFYIPSYPPDLNCDGITTKGFAVLSPDPHKFDGDKDDIDCES